MHGEALDRAWCGWYYAPIPLYNPTICAYGFFFVARMEVAQRRNKSKTQRQ